MLKFSASARSLTLAICLGLLVIARAHSAITVIAITIITVLAAKRLSTRIAVALLGGLIALGLPWIASPLVAGLAWAAAKKIPSFDAPSQSRPFRHQATQAFLSFGIGSAAGLVAAPFVFWQLNRTPLQFDIVQPATWLIVIACVLLAFLNAVGEELIWRGALLEECNSLPLPVVFLAQSGSFGLAHLFGLPGGLIGCLLTAVASVLFVLVHRRWGLGASIITHFAADLVIFIAALPNVLFTGWCAGYC
ncbi:MAG: CPBP family intramembrane metalloprotease [Leucobacter sp.]